MKSKGKVYLSFDGKRYLFFSFWLNFSDGSLYIGLGNTRKKFISFHSTGRANYRGFNSASKASLVRYFDPLCRATTQNSFFAITITALENLELATGSLDEESFIFEVPIQRLPITFDFQICPSSYVLQSPGFYIQFRNLFSLIVVCGKNREPDNLFPNVGFFFYPGYQNQAVDKHTALVEFHQRLHDTSGEILYSRNSEGIYTLVFARPKVRPPNAQIFLGDPTYKAEIVSATESAIRFRIKDKHNQTVKKDVLIQGFTLDARL